jgi:hypothetical protein
MAERYRGEKSKRDIIISSNERYCGCPLYDGLGVAEDPVGAFIVYVGKAERVFKGLVRIFVAAIKTPPGGRRSTIKEDGIKYPGWPP